MNINLKLGLATLLLVVVSCTEPDLFYSENTKIDMSKINAIMQMDETGQRTAFNLLNPEEKYHFRSLIIDEFINKNRLNQDQLLLIEELKSHFGSYVYIETDKSEYFKSIFLTDWGARASSVLSIEALNNLVAAPYENKDFDSYTSASRSLQNDCKCHLDGFFGCVKETVVGFSTAEGIKVESIRVDCDTSTCKIPGSTNDNGEYEESDTGCGWFWTEKCNGTC